MVELQTPPPPTKQYAPPPGTQTAIKWNGISVTCRADYIVLRKDERPVAELFYTYYAASRKPKQDRPITFVFNGGPGAASAYLHVGGIGPRRIQFGERGEAPALPISLAENKESWLHFTDLVFLDPIGTGFSRALQADEGATPEIKQRAAEDKKEFFSLGRDLDSLGEAIERILTLTQRWGAPTYIAGESYGGFRVGKMAKLLQEKFGIGLLGAFLISPALEFTSLEYTDYNITPWIGVYPSLVASAWWHKSGKRSEVELKKILIEGEEFVRQELAPFLVDGSERRGLFRKMAEALQHSQETIEQYRGRISPFYFVRDLLRSQQLVCGLYDASVTTYDPFADRPQYAGPEPTLTSIGVPFTHGINILLREMCGMDSDRQYQLLSYDVYHQWRLDAGSGALYREVGAADDLRYGLALNPKMVAHVSHGVFDLITPYFASKRILQLSALSAQERSRVVSANYLGGHMFYSWKKSREMFFRDAMAIYRRKLR